MLLQAEANWMCNLECIICFNLYTNTWLSLAEVCSPWVPFSCIRYKTILYTGWCLRWFTLYVAMVALLTLGSIFWQDVRWNWAMAHLFKHMYVDEVDFRETLAYVTDATVGRAGDSMFKDGNWPWSLDKVEGTLWDHWWRWSAVDLCRQSDFDYWSWWYLAGILEAFKILKYPNPSSEGKRYFATLFNLSWLARSRIYSETERTTNINNLMDYVICVCKLKYQPNL